MRWVFLKLVKKTLRICLKYSGTYQKLFGTVRSGIICTKVLQKSSIISRIWSEIIRNEFWIISLFRKIPNLCVGCLKYLELPNIFQKFSKRFRTWLKVFRNHLAYSEFYIKDSEMSKHKNYIQNMKKLTKNYLKYSEFD